MWRETNKECLKNQPLECFDALPSFLAKFTMMLFGYCVSLGEGHLSQATADCHIIQ